MAQRPMSMSVATLRQEQRASVLEAALPLPPALRRGDDREAYHRRVAPWVVRASRALCRTPVEILAGQSYGFQLYQREIDRWHKGAFVSADATQIADGIRELTDAVLIQRVTRLLPAPPAPTGGGSSPDEGSSAV